MKLNLSVDDVLATTRSVRKRLDFDKTVSRDVVLECLELAIQAPTGSNSQGWQWMFVDDPSKKLALRDIYKHHFDEYATQTRTWAAGDLRNDQAPKVRDSASYLAENFHRAPVVLIPLIEGRLEGLTVARGASQWGSLLPAVWSFMLALRERGLGSAWTTLHLQGERDAAEVLGIPYEQFSQGGMFPIAYTIGTDFKPAKRLGLDGIIHWNEW
jgi:nitroreductase